MYHFACIRADKKGVKPKKVREHRALSLIEILLAMAIISVVMITFYNSYSGTLTVIKNSISVAKENRKQTILYKIIENDLQNAYYPIDPQLRYFKVNRRDLGEKGADSLNFISLYEDLSRVSKSPNLREIGYFVKESNETLQGVALLRLYRREQFGIDKEPEKGGQTSLLFEKISSFKIECNFSESKIEWTRDCDYKSQNRYPYAVRALLSFPYLKDGYIQEEEMEVPVSIKQDKPK